MISIDAVQEGIVAFLKAAPSLVGEVGDEIRESQWQGTEFTYPAVRVRMGDKTTLIEGNCHTAHGVQPFTLLIFSEKSSSQQANQIAALAMNLLLDQQLHSADWISGNVRLRSPGLVAAIRTGDRLWRSEVHLEFNIYETA